MSKNPRGVMMLLNDPPGCLELYCSKHHTLRYMSTCKRVLTHENVVIFLGNRLGEGGW